MQSKPCYKFDLSFPLRQRPAARCQWTHLTCGSWSWNGETLLNESFGWDQSSKIQSYCRFSVEMHHCIFHCECFHDYVFHVSGRVGTHGLEFGFYEVIHQIHQFYGSFSCQVSGKRSEAWDNSSRSCHMRSL